MKNWLSMVLMLLLIVSVTACSRKEPPSSLDIQRSNTMSTVAMVERVNLEDRMVTLRSLEGRLFTVHVGEEAVNLPQVRVGDRVEITYSETLEVRMAQPGEVRDERETLMAGAKPGSKPGAVEINETNVTATILELDKAKAMAKLKMADGSIARVKVKNPKNLDKVKVGDTIAIKYLEVIAINVKGQKK
ncbi:MAG: lipoprotein [Desulfobulbus sp.]